MKRVLLILAALMLYVNVKSQTSLTEAVDFHSVDDYGTEVHLFDILDRGQNVFLYFFFSDAESSPVFDPNIAEVYREFGSNQENVYFIGVAPTDDSISVANWRETYNIDFPVIHWFSEGDRAQDICDDYGVIIFSTAVLIAPDRKILIDNIWPISSSQIILEAFAEHGIIPGENTDDIDAVGFSIFPNPAKNTINIRCDVNMETEVKIYDMTARCVKSVFISDINNECIDISDIDKGVYFVNINNSVEKLIVE